MTAKVHVTVYSRPGCHLCEDAKVSIQQVQRDEDFTVEEINIEGDPNLLSRYQYDIPVIAINGVEAFIHRVDPEEFRKRIRQVMNT